MSMVHLSVGMNPPASEHLLSEPAIVARLAAATLPQSRTPWLHLVAQYDRIRDKIAEVVDGFENFNANVRAAGGFHLHHPNRERVFPTVDGRAQFYVHPLVGATSVAIDVDDDDASRPTSFPQPLLQLMTVRSHDQYNTTVYGLDDRYRGVHGYRRVCLISRSDLDRLGFVDGDRVDVISVWEDGERIARDFLLVEYDIPPGCLASYFPETNALVPLGSHAERARTPASKSIPVRLRKAETPPA